MKKYIRASLSPEEISNAVLSNFGASHPGTGNSYIAKDGTFVNLYPKIDTHEDVCWWLEDHYDVELAYEDEEYFVREYGWVRLRSDPHMMIVELPPARLTNDQWYSLEEWLMYCGDKYSRGTTLYLNACDSRDADVEYAFGTDYFPEDILKLCKRYYSSGKLYASTLVKESAAARPRLKVGHWYQFNDRGEVHVGQYTGRDNGFECCVCGKGCNAYTFNIFYNEDEYETWAYGPNHLPSDIVEVADDSVDVIADK